MAIDAAKPKSPSVPASTPTVAAKPIEPAKTELPAVQAQTVLKTFSEGFDALKKKLMSVSGRYVAPKAPVAERADLKALVAAQRSAVNAGGVAPSQVDGAEGGRAGPSAFHKADDALPTVNESQKIDLDSAKSRRQSVDKLVQMGAGSPKVNGQPRDCDAYGCAPTTLVAGAMLSKNPRAELGKLVQYTLDKPGITETSRFPLEELRDKLKSGGELSQKDLGLLKDSLYETMNRADDGNPKASRDQPTIHLDTVKRTIQEAGLSMDAGYPVLISNDGDGKPDHFVLQQSGTPTRFYDPWPRTDGHQLVTRPEENVVYFSERTRDKKTGNLDSTNPMADIEEPVFIG